MGNTTDLSCGMKMTCVYVPWQTVVYMRTYVLTYVYVTTSSVANLLYLW